MNRPLRIARRASLVTIGVVAVLFVGTLLVRFLVNDVLDGQGDLVGAVALIVLGLAAYFLPTIVAVRRGHRKQNPIFILNLFLGWTLIGWVVCLAWAVGPTQRERTA
jgi:Superinfection immunity protein